MNPRDLNQAPILGAGTYIGPAEARIAIETLAKLERRLEERLGGGRLHACVGFSKDALWAAAYPDDPYGMLDIIAAQAENALG